MAGARTRARARVLARVRARGRARVRADTRARVPVRRGTGHPALGRFSRVTRRFSRNRRGTGTHITPGGTG